MEEIKIREIVDLLVKNKFFILLITALAVLVTGLYTFLMVTPFYESRAIMTSKDYTLTTKGAEIPALSTERLSLLSKAETLKREIGKGNFLDPLLESLALGESYTRQSLKSSLSLAVGSNGELEFKVKDTDAARARKVADKGANLLVATTNAVILAHIQVARVHIAHQLEELRSHLINARKEYTDFLANNLDPSYLTEKLRATARAAAGKNVILMESQMALKVLEAERAALEKELKGVSTTVAGELNPLYFNLAEVIKRKNATAASMERSIEEIQLLEAALEAELQALNIAVFQQSEEFARLETQLVYFQKKVEVLEDNFMELDVMESSLGQGWGLSIFSEANAASSLLKHNRFFPIAIAGVLAFFFSIFVVFLRHYWSSFTNK